MTDVSINASPDIYARGFTLYGYTIGGSFDVVERGKKYSIWDIDRSETITAIRSIIHTTVDQPHVVICEKHKALHLDRPYIDIHVEFVQKIPPTAPAQLLARGAVHSALATEDVCPVTYERYTTLNEFRVGTCGHIFSPAVEHLRVCPVCRTPTVWCTVRMGEIPKR
jgi:hypothetical protein